MKVRLGWTEEQRLNDQTERGIVKSSLIKEVWLRRKGGGE